MKWKKSIEYSKGNYREEESENQLKGYSEKNLDCWWDKNRNTGKPLASAVNIPAQSDNVGVTTAYPKRKKAESEESQEYQRFPLEVTMFWLFWCWEALLKSVIRNFSFSGEGGFCSKYLVSLIVIYYRRRTSNLEFIRFRMCKIYVRITSCKYLNTLCCIFSRWMVFDLYSYEKCNKWIITQT